MPKWQNFAKFGHTENDSTALEDRLKDEEDNDGLTRRGGLGWNFLRDLK